jgi:hypothetical protein
VIAKKKLFALYQDPSVDLQLFYIDDKIKKFDWTTIDVFLACESQFKIAAIEINYQNIALSKALIDRLRPSCDLLVIKSMELSDGILELIKDNDFPNVTFVLGGFLKFVPKNSVVDNDMCWLTSTATHYNYDWLDIVKDRLDPFSSKPFSFDVLYGYPKKHRLFLRESISQFDHQPWFYQSAFFDKRKNNGKIDMSDDDFWDEETVATYDQDYKCTYRGVDKMISQILPYKVYQKTAYSLVCETHFANHFSFFTEKIAKPILAFRLFIVFSGAGYLKNLRRLGFQTFDGIIDESYDSEDNDCVRWKMAIDQALWLCQQPQAEILAQIVPTVLHNYQVLKNLRRDVPSYHVQKFLLIKQLEICQQNTNRATHK